MVRTRLTFGNTKGTERALAVDTVVYGSANGNETGDESTQVVLVDGAIVYKQDVLRFLSHLPAESIDLIVTDPAYSGMNQHLMLGRGRIVGRYDDKGEGGKWFAEFDDTRENYDEFLRECERVLKPNRHLFIMFDPFSLLSLGPMVREYFNVKNMVVWDKVNIGMGHYFRRQTEFILFACKGKRPLSRRDISDLWRIKRLHRAPYPTQKPVELFEAMIASSRDPGDEEFLVCDPFVGSGSAAVAALKQGARFVGCDISTRAIDLCRRRLESFVDAGVDPCQAGVCFDGKKAALATSKRCAKKPRAAGEKAGVGGAAAAGECLRTGDFDQPNEMPCQSQ